MGSRNIATAETQIDDDNQYYCNSKRPFNSFYLEISIVDWPSSDLAASKSTPGTSIRCANAELYPK